MSQIAFTVAGIAFAGAVACWIAGALHTARALRAAGRDGLWWRATFAWPFATGPLLRDASPHGPAINKAIVALITCLIVAISAVSVATNLARVPR